MQEQLDKLEESITRLIIAYDELKKENESLKAQLTEKASAVTALEQQSGEVRTRIDQLIAALQSEQNA